MAAMDVRWSDLGSWSALLAALGVEVDGAVVQAGEPVVLDDGQDTLSVETTESVTLGQEVTVRGTMRDGRLDADEVI